MILKQKPKNEVKEINKELKDRIGKKLQERCCCTENSIELSVLHDCQMERNWWTKSVERAGVPGRAFHSH